MVTNLLQYVGNVGNLTASNIDDSNSLPKDISFISETKYCGMSCVLTLWKKQVSYRKVLTIRSQIEKF